VKLPLGDATGNYTDVFTGQKFKIRKTTELILEPWEFMVLEKE
jgi:hypothetical protein